METATDTTASGAGRQRHLYVPSNSVGHFYPPEEDLSLADHLAALPPEEREEILAELDMEELEHSAEFWMRPSQLAAIQSEHWMTVCLAGRGWGKTRVLSEAIHKYAMENPGARLALVGRTTSDVRDVLILGDSGILEVTPPRERPKYRPMVRRVIWENGAEAMTFSAERPDGIRGAQFHAAFCDEIGSYRTNSGSSLMNAFDQIKVATRLGDKPKIFVATTPRRVPQIIDLVEQADKKPDQVLLIRGSTLANRHLSESYKEVITGMYDGTALGRQEIDGELLADVEGALLHQSVLDEHRRDDVPSDFWKSLPYRVVGVDPSVSATPNDECGIVVCGATAERKLYKRDGYVLEDASVLGSPAVWAKEVVRMARKYRAVVVAEDNQGGEMVRMIIKEQDPKVPVTLVRSKAGKKDRAEPVGLAYERGRVHHTDWFGMLESQLTTWAPDEGMKSPDRLDACLTGDSLVTMGDGSLKRLDSIIVGELVMTRKGPRRVLAAQQTGVDRKVNVLEYGDGLQLRATDNHPIWSVERNDFVRADQLDAERDTILSCPQDMNRCIQYQTPLTDQLQWSTTALSTNDHRSHTHSELIEFTMDQLEASTKHFSTDRFLSTMESISKVFTSITSTKTPLTTHWTTSLLSPLKSTLELTTNSLTLDASTCSTTSYLPRPEKSERILSLLHEPAKQQSVDGKTSKSEKFNVQDVERTSGRETTATRTTSAVTRAENDCATLQQKSQLESAVSAEQSSQSRSICSEKSAVARAEAKLCGRNETRLDTFHLSSLLKKPDSVRIVDQTSQQIPMREESRARDLVPLTWRKVGEENANVWNLEVEGEHEYFANGILVHNCVHALTALLVNPPKQWVGGVRTRNTAEGKHIPVDNHDPLRYATNGSVNGRNIGALRRQLGQIEGVAEQDTMPHEYDEVEDANATAQKQLRTKRRLSSGTPSTRMGGVYRGAYSTPGTRIHR